MNTDVHYGGVMETTGRRALAPAIAALLLLVTLVGGRADAAPAAEPVPGPTWTVSSPEASGMDPTILDRARAYAFAEGRNTQGVVVVRHGQIAKEWYAPGKNADSYGASWSMAKSITSSLIGIAIDEGLIPSIDEPMTTYYPEWIGTPKEAITLRHVLHMESGLKWSESYDPASLGASDVIQMGLSADELTYAKDRPFEVAPGTRWNYSSGGPVMDYAQAKLFGPIGMDPVDWWVDAEGNTLTYCCVDTSSRNFARFGQLFLHNGMWGDTQVVPADWVTESRTGTDLSDGIYGLQWWIATLDGVEGDILLAQGFDGQWIYIVPSLDLVVVRNGLYGKHDGPAIADPSLFRWYPPTGLGGERGTRPPNSWDHKMFLGPIVEAIAAGAPPPTTAPAPTAPAPAPQPRAAVPVAAVPAYTG